MKSLERSRLVESHLPLVRHLAALMVQRASPYLEMDDLVAIGAEALLKAAERYDPSRGVAFGTFAYLRVRGAMVEGIGVVGPISRGVARKRRDRPGRRGLSLASRLQSEEKATSQSNSAVEEAMAAALDAARLAPRLPDALDRLGDRDREIIVRHYFGGDTLHDIGRDMGHSRSWASRIHSRALVRLRAALEPAFSRAALGQDPLGAAACAGP